MGLRQPKFRLPYKFGLKSTCPQLGPNPYNLTFSFFFF